MYTKLSQIKKKPKVKTVTVLSLSQLKKKVQRAVNAYVRKRDENEPCISCSKQSESWEAGHYIAQGSSGYLRYNFDNIHKQCVSCNRFKHGNLLEYRINLLTKIGSKRVDWLENHRKDVKKWTREELNTLYEAIKEIKWYKP